MYAITGITGKVSGELSCNALATSSASSSSCRIWLPPTRDKAHSPDLEKRKTP
jgi:hypothetical protein